MRIKYLFIIFYHCSHVSVSQSITELNGKVLDSLQMPVSDATLVFIDRDKKKNATFTRTDFNGVYSIDLIKETTYHVEISHLSYGMLTDTLTVGNNKLTKTFYLQEETFDLDAILLDVQKAISIKGDTTIYNVDSFTDGSEHKLKDIIEKLPGASIDDEGNVIYKGKKVYVSQIENREFFNGSSKLAATHIPANAIDKIEFVENYSPSRLLKGLEESDRISMNLKLKEGKKKFAFGDITLQAGLEERYLVSPTLFYYSPKNSLNAITDLNNINKNSFTVSDFLALDDYYSQIMSSGIKRTTNSRLNYQNIRVSDDLLSNRYQFYTAQHTGQINKVSDISTYIIHVNKNTSAFTSQNNEYIDSSSNNEFIERNATENSNFTLGKMVYNLYGKPKLELKSTTTLKIENPNTNFNQSVNRGTQNFLNNETRFSNDFSLGQDVTSVFNLTEKQTLNTLFEWNYGKENSALNIASNDMLFSSLPNNTEANTFLTNNTSREYYGFNLAISDYIKVSDFSHFKILAGLFYNYDQYVTMNNQIINNIPNDLNMVGFNNDLDATSWNSFFKVTYKTLIGKFIVEPSLSLDYLNLDVNQIENLNNNTLQVLPSLQIVSDYSQSEKFTMRSQFKVKPISAEILLDKLDLLAFNRVASGSPKLFFTKEHTTTLDYRNFNWVKNRNIFGNITYNRDIISVVNNSTITANEVINIPIEYNENVHNFFSNIHYDKKFGIIKISFDARYRYSQFVSAFNGQRDIVTSNRYNVGNGYDVKISNSFDFDISWSYSTREAQYANRTVNTTNLDYNMEINYTPIKGFLSSLNYNFEKFENESDNSKNEFTQLDLDFSYKSPEGMTTYFIEINNLLNSDFRQNLVTSPFVIVDRKTSYFPRIITAGIKYAF